MKEELLRHEQRGKYAYILEDGSARIMLEAGIDDIKEVYLCYYDKYGLNHIPGFIVHKAKMKFYARGRFNDFYVANVVADRRRLHYYFEIAFNTGEYKKYDASGLSDINKDIINEFSLFAIPYLNLEDSIKVPYWSNDAVVYQIFPDSFNNPEGLNLEGSKDSWGTYFMGGTLKGIEEKIPYFLELGINTIYLTPIFKANTNHRYETVDYMEIDQRLGTKEDFKSLVDSLHENKIKIILDGVFNHTSSHFFAFQDILKNQEKSKYLDWYFINSFPVSNKREEYKNLAYDTFSFASDMPKLNVMNSEVKEYIFKVLKYWTTSFNIDGWRLDVANEIPLAFWREFRTFMKNLNPNLLLIGESWNDSSIYLDGSTFDTVMNYLFRSYTFNLFKSNESVNKRIKSFIALYSELTVKYPKPCFMGLFNLISSHDVDRLYDELKDERIIKAIILMQMTLSGIPYIYYGDEVGLKNDSKFHNRGAIDWSNINYERFNYYKDLIKLHKLHSSLRNGDIYFNTNDEGVLEYLKTNDEEDIRVIINLSDKEYLPTINGKVIYSTNDGLCLNKYDALIILVR